MVGWLWPFDAIAALDCYQEYVKGDASSMNFASGVKLATQSDQLHVATAPDAAIFSPCVLGVKPPYQGFFRSVACHIWSICFQTFALNQSEL